MTESVRQLGRYIVVRGGYLHQPSPTFFEDEPAQQRLLEETLGKDTLRRLDPFCQSALYSVEMARRASGIGSQPNGATFPRHGVCVGTALGAQATRVRYSRRLAHLGPSATNPIDFPDSIDGAAAAHIAMRWGAQGPSLTFVQGAASAETALLAAYRSIASGRAERIYLAIGDVFDPWVRSSITSTYATTATACNSGNAPKDAILALVLEASDALAVDESSVLVTEFHEGKPVVSANELDGLIRAVMPPTKDPTDFSGVMQIAGAWLGVMAPMCNPEGSCQDGPMDASLSSTNRESACKLAFCRKVKPR